MALKVIINENMISKPFSFTVNGKAMETVIAKGISTLLTSASGARNFAIIANKVGKVYLAALGTDTFVLLNIPGAVSSNAGVFSFESDRLIGLIKNRGDMVFDFTENQECAFKLVKGHYRGKIVTLPFTEDMVSLFNETFFPKDKSKTTSTFTPATLELLKEGISLTAIKDIYNGNAMFSYLTFSGNKFTIIGFDDHHFGHYTVTAENDGPDFAVASPPTHFQLIEKLTSGYSEDQEPLQLSLRPEALRAATDSVIVILPLIQVDEKKFDTVPGFLSDIGKSAFKCGIDPGALNTIVENLYTLHAPNTTFNLLFKAGTDLLKFTYVTPKGTASDALRITPGNSKSVDVKIGPEPFKDVMLLAKGLKKPEFHIKADKCTLIKATTKLNAVISYVCSLV